MATPAAVVAGIVVTAAQLANVDPFFQWTMAAIAGGSIAGVIQGGTVVTRAASTSTTAGLGNPLVATGELVLSFFVSLLALLVPVSGRNPDRFYRGFPGPQALEAFPASSIFPGWKLIPACFCRFQGRVSRSCHSARLCRLLSLLGVMAAALSVRADYLSTLGPVPFQFQVVPKPVPANLLAKVPVAIVAPESPHPPQLPSDSAEHAVLPTEALAAPPESITAKSPEPYIATAALLFPPPPPEPAAEALTPQMLLQFFQSTGGDAKKAEGFVTGQVSFAPPRPDPKPPSKATSASP